MSEEDLKDLYEEGKGDYLMRGLAEIKRVLTLNAKELSLNDRQYYISVINEAMDLIRFYDLNVKRMEDE